VTAIPSTPRAISCGARISSSRSSACVTLWWLIRRMHCSFAPGARQDVAKIVKALETRNEKAPLAVSFQGSPLRYLASPALRVYSQAMTNIKFGTDGWRGVIGEDFTPENVRLVAMPLRAMWFAGEDARKGVLIGYDHRQFADRTAAEIADVFSATGTPSGWRTSPANAPFHCWCGNAARRGASLYCQSQSIRVEWDQIQGELWQQRAPIHRVPNREGTGRRVAYRRAAVAAAKGLNSLVDPRGVSRYGGKTGGLGEVTRREISICSDPMHGSGRLLPDCSTGMA